MRNMSLVFKTVKIIKGPYKGFVGLVKDVTTSTAKVELHSEMRCITFDVNHLAVIADTNFGGTTRSVTSIYGSSNTPLASSRGTPMYGGNTPHYGGATPSYQPSLGGAWDPTSRSSSASVSSLDLGSALYCPSSPSGSSNEELNSSQQSKLSTVTHSQAIYSLSSPTYVPQNVSYSLSGGEQYSPSVFEHPVYSPTSPKSARSNAERLYRERVQYPSSPLGYSPASPAQSSTTTSGGTSPVESPVFSPLYEVPPTPDIRGAEPSPDHNPYQVSTTVTSPQAADRTVAVKPRKPVPWVRAGLFVKVLTRNNVEGVIKEVRPLQGEVNLTVFVDSMDGEVYLRDCDVAPRDPRVQDVVLVIKGEDAGKIGLVVSIEFNDAIVTFDQDTVKMIQLKYLCPVQQQ